MFPKMGNFFPLSAGLESRFPCRQGIFENRPKEKGRPSFAWNKTIFFYIGQRFSFADPMQRRVVPGSE